MKTREGAHVRRYLADMERWRRDVDGVYQLATARLREAGGPIWMDGLAQVDIINIVVAATREYDAGRRKRA